MIGGTSLFGGRGSVWNAILGALVIGSLGNGLDLSGASAADNLMFSDAILLLAAAMDAVSRQGTTSPAEAAHERIIFDDRSTALAHSTFCGSGDRQMDGSEVVRTALITGLDKPAPLRQPPFSHYCANMARDVVTADVIYVIGSGLVAPASSSLRSRKDTRQAMSCCKQAVPGVTR